MANIPINLPWFITFHASGLCILGLSLIFKPSTTITTGATKPPPSKPVLSTPPPSTVLGIATLGLGLSYFSTSYMPIPQNAFLHATVPVRLILAALAGIKAMIGGVDEDRRTLWGILAWDGIGAVILGSYLGVWDGRAPGHAV